MAEADNSFDEPGTLMQATQKLLERDKRTLLEIYRDTGIPYYWLKKFSKGAFPNPSVNRVQYLYEALSGTNLTI